MGAIKIRIKIGFGLFRDIQNEGMIALSVRNFKLTTEGYVKKRYLFNADFKTPDHY